MRLFTAIELGDEILAEAARVVDALRRRAPTTAPRARIAWVAPERMHVTVRFIGQVDDSHASAIRNLLAPPVDVPAFDLEVVGTGAFPPRGAPRVMWAGLGDGQAALAALEREVTARLASAGVAPEERPYRPHVTLGRVKEPAGLRSAALLDGFLEHRFGRARIDAITLFESRLSPKGPTYVALLRTLLVGRA